MEELEKTSKEEAVLNPVDKLQEAAELIKADQQRRELEAAKEYEEFLVNWTKKHNITVGFSQPQLIIQAL